MTTKRKAAGKHTTRTAAKTPTKGKAKPIKAATPASTNSCACGCGKPTAHTFAMGHDAKAKSLLLRVDRGELKATDIPTTLRTPELAKGDGLIARLLRKLGA